MKKTFGNVVLITGASSGIGRATAEYLSPLFCSCILNHRA